MPAENITPQKSLTELRHETRTTLLSSIAKLADVAARAAGGDRTVEAAAAAERLAVAYRNLDNP